ncbi:MAG: IS110 family transposase [Candidatus Methanoplasma sp.]|nr:IS110 family transposase [Candidatus Methanoplasma sp.]
MKIAIGMDVHAKNTSAYAVHVSIGEVPDRHEKLLSTFNREFGNFPSTAEGMEKMAAFLSKHECHALIENTTKSHEVYWMLKNLGIDVTMAQAADLHRITMSVKKTDRNDSIELAGYMRRRLNGENEFAECFVPSPEWMTKRELCRGAAAERKYLSDVKRKIRAHLLLHGIHLSKEYGNITSAKALVELSSIKDPYLMMQVKFAVDAKRRIEFAEKTIKYMFAGNRTYELILSVTGFGVLSAAYFTSMVIDIGRFPSKSKFTASFGVVPKMRASAESNPHCSTTHRGDELARHMLMFCTIAHMQHAPDSVVTEMYRRLVKNGKPKREALVAAGRKLLTVMWSVLKSNKPYSKDEELLRLARETEESENER